MRDDRFEHIAHLEIVRIPLVVKNVAARDGGPIQVPDQRLLAKRQVAESVDIQLDHRGFANPLDEILPIGRHGGRRIV